MLHTGFEPYENNNLSGHFVDREIVGNCFAIAPGELCPQGPGSGLFHHPGDHRTDISRGLFFGGKTIERIQEKEAGIERTSVKGLGGARQLSVMKPHPASKSHKSNGTRLCGFSGSYGDDSSSSMEDFEESYKNQGEQEYQVKSQKIKCDSSRSSRFHARHCLLLRSSPGSQDPS